jgi:hypothetical protein
MEISQIKARLSILSVLDHYGLKPDRNNRLCCPFHDDKTPSMPQLGQGSPLCQDLFQYPCLVKFKVIKLVEDC